MRYYKTFTVWSLFALVGSISRAEVIFDTLVIPNTLSLPNPGQSFTTGALGSNNQLSTIVLKSATTNAADASANFTGNLTVYQDTNNVPTDWNLSGSALGLSDSVFVNPAVDGTGTLYTFSFASLPVLTDNTVYLIAIACSASAPNTRSLGMGNDPGGIGSAGGNLFRAVSPTAGTAFTGLDLALQVNTVPEPGTLALAGLAGLGVIASGWLRRFRRG